MQAPRTIQRRRPLTQLDSDLHPVLQRVFEHRGIADKSELDYSLSQLLPPDGLKGIEQAATVLLDAITNQAAILIVGNYDADGATATAIAIKGIRLLGGHKVDYLVPNRFSDGYGLSAGIAVKALERQPDLVITVDNGIAGIDGVELLTQAGVQVIITDHHLPGQQLPRATAIVNPNQPGCEFDSKMLAGVGVMFYLLLALRSLMRERDLFNSHSPQPNLVQLLDLVALGTVADVVPLDHNNRILVARGVARIRAGKACPGIVALIQIAARKQRELVASDLGYVVAPRLNAAGRLDDISTGIECLLSTSPTEAWALATQLDQINQERRQIEQQMQQQAMAILQQKTIALDPETATDSGICLYDENWHLGVTGLVASRLKEKFTQPVIAFARAADGTLKGSARSVPGIHIRDLLDLISKQQPSLIAAFGGHAMAAGLTIAATDYPVFAQAFKHSVAHQLAQTGVSNTLLSDGELTADQFSLKLAETLRVAAPWGQSFPTPCFDGEFKVVEQRIVGKLHLKLVLQSDDQRFHDAIHFRFIEENQAMPRLDRVRLLYQLEVNEYRGQRKLQLIVEYLEIVK